MEIAITKAIRIECISPALLAPAIRHESLAHFYRSNTFVIKDGGPQLGALSAWMQAIRLPNRIHIKQPYFESTLAHIPNWETLDEYLKSCPQRKKLPLPMVVKAVASALFNGSKSFVHLSQQSS